MARKRLSELNESDEIERLRRQLDREARARAEAESLLESKSAELFDALHRLQAEAHRANELTIAIEAAQDGIAITDAEGRFIYMNRAHEVMFDFDPGELNGQLWSVLYEGDVLAHFENEIMPEFFRAGYWRGEAVGVGKHGVSVVQEVSLTALPSGGIICATRDISVRKSRELHMRDLTEKLQSTERDAALFALASAISHDLSNLLFAVRGHATLLKYEVDPGSAADEIADKIMAASSEAEGVVQTLVRSRTTEPLREESVEVVKTIESALSALSSLTPDGLSVSVECPERVCARTNETLLYRCILNLAKNAFEACSSGDKITISIRAENASSLEDTSAVELGIMPAEEVCVLQVTDTGMGMSPEQIENMTDPFYSTKAEEGGSGLGLLPLKMLAESSDALVRVWSERNAGTRFMVVLPLCDSAPE